MSNKITLSDGTTSIQLYADETASPIYNANSVVTIGGIPRSQADSFRLQIDLRIACEQSDLPTLNDILTNFSEQLYYTPSRILAYKNAIETMSVILDGSPKIKPEGKSSELIYTVELKLQEVKG